VLHEQVFFLDVCEGAWDGLGWVRAREGRMEGGRGRESGRAGRCTHIPEAAEAMPCMAGWVGLSTCHGRKEGGGGGGRRREGGNSNRRIHFESPYPYTQGSRSKAFSHY